MTTRILLFALAALLSLPGASAGEELVQVANPVDGTTIYVASDGVWQEINRIDGLQRSETAINDGTRVPADQRVAP